VGEGQWLIARLDGEEKAREQTYAEARAEARAKFIEEKAAADLKAAAEAALAKIKEAKAAGKSFADAAKEAGVTETKSASAVTASYKPDAITEPATLFQAASKVDPGGFGDVLIESDRAFILHVVSRELVKDNNQNETLVFDSWLASRVEAAKVDQIWKRNK
jgi:parvulin-like peptidyl-prolyl isomerase